MISDPKPAKRIRDRTAFQDFYAKDHACLVCGWHFCEAHHVLHRSQGGDDVLANLVPLCSNCHMAAHGATVRGDFGRDVTPEIVRFQIAYYIRSEAGSDLAAYLIGKLSPFGAEAFVQKLEA
jgi:hypothetical protein